MKKILTKGLYIASAIFLFIVTALPAGAQSFSRSNLATGGLYTALAKDASNNIFVTRVTPGTGGATYQVVEYIGGAGSPVIIYSGLTHEFGDYPWGLTVTSTGNIFISTDFTSAAGSIIKLTKTGGSYTTSTYQTGRYFAALAVDASDNLYTTEYDVTHKTYAVVKYAANSQGGTTGTNLYDNLTSAAGYTYPTGLAVAPNGDVYVGDAFSNTPSVTDGGHVYKLKASASYAVSTISSGRYATALAFDASGDLFSSENGGSGYKLMEYAAGGVSGTSVFFPMHSNGIYYPWGIAVINADKIFAIDGDDGTLGGAVMKLISNNSTLSNLVPSVGTLDQPFNPAITNYKVNVGSAVTSIKLTPTAPDALETITVNGTAVASGSASGSIALSFGFNSINTVVTAPDGVTTTTYTVIVNRLSNNANLSNLTFDQGTIAPSFSPSTTSYAVTVPNDVSTATVTPTAADLNATITVNGVAVASGSATGYISLAVGTNNIVTTVTAQDGTTTKSYTIVVTRQGSSNANLNGLVLSGGAVLTPSFLYATTSYTASVTNATTSITVTPTVADATATIKVNGTTVASGSASGNLPLAVGNNVIKTVVTAQDGITVKTYTVTVLRPSNNTYLSNLTVSSGTLRPAFAMTTATYTDTVTNATSSITVTPTLNNPNGSLTVNGVAVTSGTASGSIPLVVGNNTITTVVTAQDGVSHKTYTLTVLRPSNNAYLTNLTVSNGTLTPEFSISNGAYADTVSNATTSITVTPTLNNPNSTIAINGVAASSGAPSAAIPLNQGNNVINVVVTAQDGVTTKTYAITVNRISNNAYLANLTLSSGTLTPAFLLTTNSYTAGVSNATTSITLTPTTNNPNAKVKVNGLAVASGSASAPISLVVGPNTITTVVTAQDGTTTKTYTVVVTRFSNNAYLSNLAISSGNLTPAFAMNTNSYTASVTAASITVTPTLNNPNSSVTVNGTAVASGTASGAIALNIGSNVITTVVTAQDGTTHKTYTVTINRLVAGLTYTTPNVYTPGTAIAPLAPASPTGVAAPNYGAPFTIATGFQAPGSLGVDAMGNVYVPDTYNNVIEKIPAGGGAMTVVGTGLNHPAAVAVDAAGNLFVADNGSNSVIEIPIAGGPNIVLLSTGLDLPYGIAVDTHGNVFVADTYDNQVKMIPAGTTNVVVMSSAFNHPTSLACDALGNIYVCDSSNNAIDMIPAGGGTPVTVASGLNVPWAIALDGAGNLYVTNLGDNTLVRIPKDTGIPAVLSSAFLHPLGVAADGKGNIIVANTYNNTVMQMTPVGGYYVNALPFGLSFSNATGTFSGTPLASSPATNYTVTAYNADVSTSGVVNIQVLQSADLAGLSLSSGALSPTFAPATTGYLATVTNVTASITVTPVTADANSTIKVNGTTVVSGTPSANIALVVGNNIITTVVTAADGTTTKTYTVTVTRPSNNAYLSHLTISSGTLTPAFVSTTAAYTDAVANSVTSVTVTPTVNNPNSTVKVNGNTVASGTASASIPLAVGANTITAVVTAQDGVTHKTYTITVTRASGGANSLYLPGSGGETPLVTSLGEKVEANNILSPNGDGVNDIWVVKNIAFYPNNTVTVYDRTGRVVFTKKGYANDWAGTYRGSVLNEGTYYYSVDLGNGTINKGFITVVSH